MSEKILNEAIFRRIMAVIIVLTIAIVIAMEFRKSVKIPQNKLFERFNGISFGLYNDVGEPGRRIFKSLFPGNANAQE